MGIFDTKPTKRRDNPEDRLHESVVAEARWRLRRGVFFFHVPNQSKGPVAWRMKLKRLGLRAGTPDLVFVWEGKAHFIELKAPNAKKGASDNQVDAHSEIKRAGAPVAICRNLDEVLSCWNKWGLTNKSPEDAVRRAG